jgi:hypothetical protein
MRDQVEVAFACRVPSTTRRDSAWKWADRNDRASRAFVRGRRAADDRPRDRSPFDALTRAQLT